jgi:hypothetical protein
MNRLDKKQIFLGTILGIILSILTLILLTRNIQPLSAQQTTKYTTFKTENEGFKFVRRELTSAYYEGENTKTNYGAAPTSYIGKRYYLYKRTGDVDGTPYPQLSCDINANTIDCPKRIFFESIEKFPIPPQYAGDTYERRGRQAVYTFIEPVIVKPIYEDKPAPIFAQTTIIPYSIIFWVEIPEMRGDPYDPFNFPGTAAIEIRPCTGVSLSGQIQESLYQALITKLVSNNSSFKVGTRVGTSPGYDYFSTNYVAVSYKRNLNLWDKLTKSVGCPKRILTYSFTILNESDAGVENEKRYLNLSILDPMVVWLSDKNTDALRFQLYWSSRGGPYKVPIQVTLFGAF